MGVVTREPTALMTLTVDRPTTQHKQPRTTCNKRTRTRNVHIQNHYTYIHRHLDKEKSKKRKKMAKIHWRTKLGGKHKYIQTVAKPDDTLPLRINKKQTRQTNSVRISDVKTDYKKNQTEKSQTQHWWANRLHTWNIKKLYKQSKRGKGKTSQIMHTKDKQANNIYRESFTIYIVLPKQFR